MAFSTAEIVFVILGLIAIGIAVWYFVIAKNYTSHLTQNSYARGANAVAPATLNLACDSDHQICVSSVTQICTNPTSSNFEGSNLEPISGGADTTYGAFDPKTTVDMTATVAAECNGQSTCSFDYTNNVATQGWQTIGATGTNSCNGQTQVIATYVCVPKGQGCNGGTGIGTTPKYNTAYSGNYYYTTDNNCVMATDKLAWGWSCKNATSQSIKLWMLGNTTDEDCSYNYGFMIGEIPANSTMSWQQTKDSSSGVAVYNTLYQNCQVWAQTSSGAPYGSGILGITSDNTSIYIVPSSDGIDIGSEFYYYNTSTKLCTKVSKNIANKVNVKNMLSQDVVLKIQGSSSSSTACTTAYTIGTVNASTSSSIEILPNASWSILLGDTTAQLYPVITSTSSTQLYIVNAWLFNTNQNNPNTPLPYLSVSSGCTNPTGCCCVTNIYLLTDVPPFSESGYTSNNLLITSPGYTTAPHTGTPSTVTPIIPVGFILQNTTSDSITFEGFEAKNATPVVLANANKGIVAWNKPSSTIEGIPTLFAGSSNILIDNVLQYQPTQQGGMPFVANFSLPSTITSDMLVVVVYNGATWS